MLYVGRVGAMAATLPVDLTLSGVSISVLLEAA